MFFSLNILKPHVSHIYFFSVPYYILGLGLAVLYLPEILPVLQEQVMAKSQKFDCVIFTCDFTCVTGTG